MTSKSQSLEQALAHIAAGKAKEKDFAALKGRLDEMLITATRDQSSLAEVGIMQSEGDGFVFYTVNFPEFFGAVYPKGLSEAQWREHARQTVAFVIYVFAQAKLENRDYSGRNWIQVPVSEAGILPIEDKLTGFNYGVLAGFNYGVRSK